MAYGFNNDKSKVEVYAKDDIVILEKESSSLAFNAVGNVTFNATDLAQAGIDDLSEWSIISCTQRNVNGSTVYEKTASVVSSDYVCPRVTIVNSSAISVSVYNDYAYATKFMAKVILMRINS